MSEEFKDYKGSKVTFYGEEVLMMRIDDCLVFGNKNSLREFYINRIDANEMTHEKAIDYLINSGWLLNHDKELMEKHTAKVTGISKEVWGGNYGGKCGCGHWVYDGLPYCPNCGVKLDWGEKDAEI